MSLAIIGAGLIGRKRALSLPQGVKLSVICDIDEKKGREFSEEFGCEYIKEWKKVIESRKISSLIIATSNDLLSEIAIAAISSGKHVLIEKPGGRSLKEIKETLDALRKKPVVVKYGYNHRFHPAVQKAKEIIDSKKFGEILFIRARYGHGGRLNYNKEWRFNKLISGGGQLLDQGSHLIDLVNFLCGKMDEIRGYTANLFWGGEVEDSAFILLKNSKNQIASLSTTCLEWKNIFSLEIMLKKAKIQIDGLGRSYGQEKLTLYKMKPKMGLPDPQEFSFTQEDLSWKEENKLFFRRISNKDYSTNDLEDAIYVFEVIEKVYSNR